METPIKAHEYYLQGFRLHSQMTEKSNALAQVMFKLASKEHPKYARAIGHLAYSRLIAWLSGWIDTAEPPDDLRKLADKAVALDPDDYDNLWTLAGVYLYTAKFESNRAAACKKALDLYDAAIQKAKDQAITFNQHGLNVDLADAKFFTATTRKDVDGAIKIAQKAIASVNSKHPKRFLWTLGWAYYERAYFTGRDADYIRSLDALLKIASPSDQILRNIIANYVALGWIKPAQRLAREVMSRCPRYALTNEDRWPYQDSKRLKRWKDHLAQAGLPDKPRSAK
jgi:hypothetical protein